MLEGTVRAWLSYLIDHMTYVSIYHLASESVATCTSSWHSSWLTKPDYWEEEHWKLQVDNSNDDEIDSRTV